MRCEGDRCAALSGEIGTATACTIYAVRPLVCRDCVPGDDACSIARAARGMAPVASVGGGVIQALAGGGAGGGGGAAAFSSPGST